MWFDWFLWDSQVSHPWPSEKTPQSTRGRWRPACSAVVRFQSRNGLSNLEVTIRDVRWSHKYSWNVVTQSARWRYITTSSALTPSHRPRKQLEEPLIGAKTGEAWGWAGSCVCVCVCECMCMCVCWGGVGWGGNPHPEQADVQKVKVGCRGSEQGGVCMFLPSEQHQDRLSLSSGSFPVLARVVCRVCAGCFLLLAFPADHNPAFGRIIHKFSARFFFFFFNDQIINS